MRVIVAADLEGISGVCVFDQTRDRTTIFYQEARRLLMGDIKAVVEGCKEGGATDIVVEDEHAAGFNFIAEAMPKGAVYLTGKSRPKMSQRGDLYSGFDAAILLGYHAMAGTKDGILSHTQSSLGGNRYWYNGREMGEVGQAALRFGHYGTPIVMVSGDDAVCRETGELLGDSVVTVSVKKGVSIEYGLLLQPEEAHRLIREGARQAMQRVSECKPFKMELPITGRLRLNHKEKVDAMTASRSTRIDDHTIEAVFESAKDIYEF